MFDLTQQGPSLVHLFRLLFFIVLVTFSAGVLRQKRRASSLLTFIVFPSKTPSRSVSVSLSV